MTETKPTRDKTARDKTTGDKTTGNATISDKSALSSRRKRPKVPPFARYKGTSAWRKDRRRVRAYARFKAEEKAGHPQFGAVHA